MTIMNRLILHHTGGGYLPSKEDLAAYHEIVDGNCRVHTGNHPISANAPGQRLVAGRYAAHVAGLNTGSIGLAMACMADGVWSRPFESRFFPKETQVRAMIRRSADLCIEYDIRPTDKTVLTHAEVQGTLGVKQKNKWDFDYDPFGEMISRDPSHIGSMLRDLIKDEIAKIGGHKVIDRFGQTPLIRRGASGEAVLEVQRHLKRHGADLLADGKFGPASEQATRNFQKEHELLADGIVGKMTWAALREES